MSESLSPKSLRSLKLNINTTSFDKGTRMDGGKRRKEKEREGMDLKELHALSFQLPQPISLSMRQIRGARLARCWYRNSLPSFPSFGAFRAAGTAKQPQGPLLVSATGAPLSSSSSSGAGPDLELTAENAAQVLQSGSPFLLLVGELENQVAKKIGGLQKAAQGRLPLVRLNCSTLPQVCQALQIASSPTLLLMAKGQAGVSRMCSGCLTHNTRSVAPC